MSTSTKSQATAKPVIRKPDVNQLRASLNAPTPKPGAVDVRPGDVINDAFQRLPVMNIKRYEHNPRKGINPAYLELKESIKATRAKNVILSVTRRPGESEYTCSAGGNTTLTAMQELWAETKDHAFETVKTNFSEWTNDITIIVAHLAENDNRGDIGFWDKAVAVVDLKSRIENANGGNLISIESFIAEVSERGLSKAYNTTTVRAFFFATETLQPIGQWLTLQSTKVIQPRVNLLRKIAQALGKPVLEINTLINSTLERQAIVLQDIQAASSPTDVTVDANATCAALDSAFAASLGVSDAELASMLASSALRTGQSLTAQALLEAARAGTGTVLSQGVDHAAATPPMRSPAGQSLPGGRQLPLQPAMLAPLPGAAATPATQTSPGVASDGQTAAPGAGIRHLDGQSAVSGHDPAAGPSAFLDPAWLTLRPTGPSDDPGHPDHAAGTVLSIVREIAETCALKDLVFVAPAMPLGFYCELPSEPFSADFVLSQPAGADGIDDPEWSGKRASALRRCGWQMLVAISGQCDQQISPKLPRESKWRQAAESGTLAAAYKSMGMGANDPQRGGIQISIIDIYRFMYSPELGENFLALWSWVQRWIQSEPDRFPFEIFPAR